MGTLIHSVGHGLSASETIMLGNLAGGTGLSENTVYYVLAAGLTADDFAVSLTDGGAAVAYTTDITDGVIVRTDTYTAVSDGVMDPPGAIATPSQPVMVSDTTTGVVRMTVTLVAPTDPRIKAVEFQITDEYDVPASAPADPIFDNAQTMTLQPSITTFSVRVKPLTWYSARVRHLDIYGNASAWTVPSGVDDADVETAAGYDSVSAIDAATASLLDHQIGTVEIEDGAITADLLASQIVLAGTIIAGSPTGSHIELNSAGEVLYDASLNPQITMPTDGSPVTVRGNITAGTLTAEDSAEFKGETSFAAGSVATMQAGVTAPLAAPTLVQGWDTKSLGIGARSGLWSGDYTATGGAGGSTKCFYLLTQAGSTYYITEVNAATGAYIRESSIGTTQPWGIAVLGSYLYVSFPSSTVRRYAISSLALDTTYSSVSYPNGAGSPSPIASDGTNLYIVGSISGTVKYSKYNSAMSVVSGPTAVAATFDPFDVAAGTFDFGAFRLLLVETSGAIIRSYDASGTEQTGESFPHSGAFYLAYGDADGDGARFWTSRSVGSGPIAFNKHTNWTWTSGGDVYWVGYAWYDPDGTTHETALGSLASATVGKRKRLQVTTAAIPGAGGADDPDNARVYMKQSATSPTLGTLWLQVTDALTSRYLTSYVSSGTNDGAGTAFPAGGVAELGSSTTGWTLKGSGLINRTGTAFPSSPATDDQFWRSDLGMEFFYDGTRWRSTTIFTLPISLGHNTSWSATTSNVGWAAQPTHGGTDIWLIGFTASFFVNSGGTALSASHKWDVALQKLADGSGSFAAVATATLDSGASAAGRRVPVTIEALLDSSNVVYRVNLTKTGTPGAIFVSGVLEYRVVAT